MLRAFVGAGVAAVVATCVGLARAEGPAEALAGGHLIVSADRVASVLTYTSATVTPNGSTTSSTGKSFSIGFATNGRGGSIYTTPRLALDAVISRFTIGGSVWVATDVSATQETNNPLGGPTISQDRPKTTYWGVAPRAGYLLPAGDMVAFWPRLGIEYHQASVSSVTNNGVTTPGGTVNEVAADLEANLVVTPWTHFGLLFNGYAAIPIGGSLQPDGVPSTGISELVVGLSVGLLGYF